MVNRRGLLKLLPGAAILAAFGPRLTKAAPRKPEWPPKKMGLDQAGVEIRTEYGFSGSVSYVLFNKNILLDGRLYLRDTPYQAGHVEMDGARNGFVYFRFVREGNFWTGEPPSVPIPRSGVVVIGMRSNPYMTERYEHAADERARRWRKARRGRKAEGACENPS